MTRGVYAVARDTSIETAARLLATKHISGAPVVSARGVPVGVVSLKDLVDPDQTRSDREGYPLFYQVTGGLPVELGDDVNVSGGRVEDVMSPFVLSIKSSATLVEAARTMLREGIHRLLVLEGSELVGIVTVTDLLRGFVDGQ